MEAQERAKKRNADGDQTDEKALIQDELPKIMLNPNVFTDFKVAGDSEVVTDIFCRENRIHNVLLYLDAGGPIK